MQNREELSQWVSENLPTEKVIPTSEGVKCHVKELHGNHLRKFCHLEQNVKLLIKRSGVGIVIIFNILPRA